MVVLVWRFVGAGVIKPHFIPVILLACALLVSSATAGFYDLFANFRQYDDEGYWLIATRLFMDGHPFYDRLSHPYGPVSLATHWLFHDVLSIPVTNSATRFISLGYWMILSALCALATWRITHSPWWGIAAYGLVFAYMQAFTNEPGHPQEVIASLAAAIPLVFWSTSRRSSRLAWYCTGVLVASIVSTKVNIGMYCLAGVLVVLASELRDSRWRAVLLFGAVAASAIAPWLLMYTHLNAEHSVSYAFICSAALTATALVMTTNHGGRSLGLPACAALLGGIVTALVAWLLFIVMQGSTIKALVASNLLFVSTLEHIYLFREYVPAQIVLALVALLFAVTLVRWPAGVSRENSVPAAKLVFVCLAIYAVTKTGAGNGHVVLGWAGPLSWLCAVDCSSSKTSITRKLLAAIATWHLLLAYPIPGSQLYFGTFLVLVSAIVCLADLSDRFARRAAYPAIASAVLVLVLLLNRSYSLKQQYAVLLPFGFNGAELMRGKAKEVERYQYLVAAMGQADVGFTSSGFNSLYIWSGVAMPAPIIVQHSLLFTSAADRLSIMRGLRAARTPLVLIRLPAYGAEPQKVDLIDWIMSEFEIVEKYRGYLLMKPRPVTVAPTIAPAIAPTSDSTHPQVPPAETH